MKTGQPVRIEFTREENFLAATHRYPTICYLKYGAKKDGTLTAIQTKIIGDMGAYRHHISASGVMEIMKGVYRCPNLKGEAYTVYTNKPEGGAMRCVGHPQGQFAQEVHMDIMAEKLGLDPMEFRLKNHAVLKMETRTERFLFPATGWRCASVERPKLWAGGKNGENLEQFGHLKKGLGMAIHACGHAP